MRYQTSSIRAKEKPVSAAAARMKFLGVADTRGGFVSATRENLSRRSRFFGRLFFTSAAAEPAEAASGSRGVGVSPACRFPDEAGIGGPAQESAASPTSALTTQLAQSVL